MLWPAQHLDEVYQKVCAVALKGGCTVVIFVALDCDALCACRVLTGLLKGDGVAYKIVPVQFREQLASSLRDAAAEEDIRSLVLLNCGGGMDLERVANLDQDTLCYVIDSHRPLHHANLLPSHDRVIVFADERMDEEETKEAAEALGDVDSDELEKVLAGGEEEDEEENELDGRDEAGDDADSDAGSDAGRDEQEQEEEDNDDDDDEEEEEEMEFGAEEDAENVKPVGHPNAQDAGGSASPKKDRATDVETVSLGGQSGLSESLAGGKRKRMASDAGSSAAVASKRNRVMHYYRIASWGAPAAHVMVAMAQQMNKANKLHMWLGIVGTTFHYLENHMHEEDYSAIALDYRDLVRNRTARAERYSTEDSVAIPIAERDCIQVSEEFRLTLYRHWSLRESFYNSEYVAAKLQTWRNGGKARLDTLFAKMGISLKESEQMYSFMNFQHKRDLRKKVDTHSRDFDLEDDFVYGSFQFKAGYNSQLSAADAAHTVSALLDGFALSPGAVAQLQGGLAAASDAAAAPEAAATAERDLWQESFNRAYDALDFSLYDKNTHLFEEGFRLAKIMQRAVVEEGAGALLGQKISSAGDFRYCVLEGLSPKMASIFFRPSALWHFARFVMFAQKAAGRWVEENARPLVVAAKGGASGLAHFVGIPALDMGEVRASRFGHYFRQAARMVHAECLTSASDDASVQVRIADIQRFLLALHEVCSSAAALEEEDK